jgi:hypothetical protein
MAVTDGLGRFWQFINRSQEEVAMKKILIFSVVRFAAFAVPIAVMCFVHWRPSLTEPHIGLDAMTNSEQVDGPVGLRPTWKRNLFWLLVVAVVVIAVASWREIAMTKLLMFLALGFALSAAPAAVMYPQSAMADPPNCNGCWSSLHQAPGTSWPSGANLRPPNRWPPSNRSKVAMNSDHRRELLRHELLEVGIAVFVIAILFGLTVSVGLFIIHYM